MEQALFLGLLIILISGCSSSYMVPYDDDKQLVLDGGLPMPFYDMSMKSQDYPRCHEKGFCALPPLFKERDFKVMSRPWSLMAHGNGFSIYTGISLKNRGIILDYNVEFTSSTSKYTEREREVEAGNVKYLRHRIRWLKPTDKLTIEHHGKENYSCIVAEKFDVKRGRKKKRYRCEKYNAEKTKVVSIVVNMIYTKDPDLPKELEPLAKEYTYEDLLQRSQRVLDSLYIKAEWDD